MGDNAEATIRVSLLDGSLLGQHSLSATLVSNGDEILRVRYIFLVIVDLTLGCWKVTVRFNIHTALLDPSQCKCCKYSSSD